MSVRETAVVLALTHICHKKSLVKLQDLQKCSSFTTI
jgi:hypothetical protein